MKFKFIIFGIFAIAITSCTVVQYKNTTTHQATQLETREFQTRNYDTNDTKLIMKALVNVLQDDGYIITNAVTDLGVLMAKKEINLNTNTNTNAGTNTAASNDFWFEFFRKLNDNYSGNHKHRNNTTQEQIFQKMKLVEVSINVTEYGATSRVRANFQAKILDNQGNIMNVYPVDDGKFYQDFFAKVDKSIFLQKNGL